MTSFFLYLNFLLFIASAERAKFWVKEVRKHEEECRIWLCGTKLDLVTEDPKIREVDFHDMTDFADTVRPPQRTIHSYCTDVTSCSMQSTLSLCELYLQILFNTK